MEHRSTRPTAPVNVPTDLEPHTRPTTPGPTDSHDHRSGILHPPPLHSPYEAVSLRWQLTVRSRALAIELRTTTDLTVRDVAALLGVSPGWIPRLVSAP